MRVISGEELPALTEQWRAKIASQWSVTAEIVSKEKMSRPEHSGEIEYVPGSYQATIRLVDPADHLNPDWDMEKTLVHELLHLAFSVIDEIVERHPNILFGLEELITETASKYVEEARSVRQIC